MVNKATKVGFVFMFVLGVSFGGFFLSQFFFHNNGSNIKALRDAMKKTQLNSLCFCEYLPDLFLLEQTIATIVNVTKEECCEACVMHKECNSWTAIGLSNICLLKPTVRDEVRAHSKAQTGTWSGVKCIPHPPLSHINPMLQVPAAIATTAAATEPTTTTAVTEPVATKKAATVVVATPGKPREFASESERISYLENLTDQKARQEAIQEAILHAWKGYADTCFGQDDLRPLSKSCDNWLGAQGNTLIDSMSTLYLAGLTKEFERAREWVSSKMSFSSVSSTVSHFETVIRVLGGLLSSFDLSGDKVFLDKATELANRMSNVFGSKTGLPFHGVNIARSTAEGDGNTLADVGTVTMEYFSLTHSSGEIDHRNRAHTATKQIRAKSTGTGLYYNHFNVNSGMNDGSISFGGEGDSFYEYLLKLWLLTGRRHEFYRTMYKDAIAGMQKKLVRKAGGNTWVSDSPESGTMGHLACFVPGMLALGAASGAVDGPTAKEHLQLAEEMGSTCYRLYESQATGIGPENVRFSGGQPLALDRRYINRPETTEGVFYLWRVTKNPKYREWGWKIFVAMEKHCRTPLGYAGLNDVTNVHGGQIDKMESFFIAETLKYLFLLQSGDGALPLAGIDDDQGKKQGDFFVLNTEAHPLRAWDDDLPLNRRRLMALALAMEEEER